MRFNTTNKELNKYKRRIVIFVCTLAQHGSGRYIICNSKYTGSIMFIRSLDAEKCFDSIWHDSLFNKLYNALPDVHWRFLRKWYSNTDVVIKWDGYIHYSTYFKVARCTRQGSILSPVLFNLFLSCLMPELSLCERVGNHLYNSFAYDDVSLFSTTVPGLHKLIDVCKDYSSLWRFNFGIKKTKCMNVWYLKNKPIQNVEDMDILGVTMLNTTTMLVLEYKKLNEVCFQ